MSERQGPPRYEDYLRHILEASERVARYTGALDKPAFVADEKTRDAVIRNLEIVGEAARRILEQYPEFAGRNPEIPSNKIYAMRNRLSHGYFEINLDIVWDTIKTSLPELEQHARRLLGVDPGAKSPSGTA